MSERNLSPSEEPVLRGATDELPGTRQRPPGDVRRLVDRGHRVRPRHWAILGVTAGCAAIAVVVGSVFHASGPTPEAVRPASSFTGTAGLAPLTLKPRPEDHTAQRGIPLRQPAHPVVGTSYPYNWFAHCGMSYITFAGQTWKVDHPVAVPAMHPDAKGVTWGPPIVPGYVTLVSATRLRFDAPTYITAVPLHLTRETAPVCS